MSSTGLRASHVDVLFVCYTRPPRAALRGRHKKYVRYYRTHDDCKIRGGRYSGYTLRSEIEAPLITREVLPETYFLLVIMAADAQARPFLQFQASC